jgi:hypothetical protein
MPATRDPAADEISARIISMECAALERWGNGDPSGFLEICAPDIVYFDPHLQKRIDGREPLSEYYQALWGQVSFDRFELINPLVQNLADAAVLTFNFVSYSGADSNRWNCTEVYKRQGETWEIIQTHWSFTLAARADGGTSD